MNSEELYQVIKEIDNELDQIKPKEFISSFGPLIRLRNKLLLKYKPCPSIDWEIKNSRVIKMLKKANWELCWK